MELDNTQAIAELWQGSDVVRLVGATATLTNVRTGATITGRITKAEVSAIDKASELYVEGLTYVSEVRVEGISGSLELATPFVSEYLRTTYNYWLLIIQA